MNIDVICPTIFQLSFGDENKNLPSGSYDVKFYDEDGYANLRKVNTCSFNTHSYNSFIVAVIFW